MDKFKKQVIIICGIAWIFLLCAFTIWYQGPTSSTSIRALFLNTRDKPFQGERYEKLSASWGTLPIMINRAITLLGCMTTLQLVFRARLSRSKTLMSTVLWIVISAFIFSTDFWAVNFIRQNTLTLLLQSSDRSLTIKYDSFKSLMSLLIYIAGGIAGFLICAKPLWPRLPSDWEVLENQVEETPTTPDVDIFHATGITLEPEAMDPKPSFPSNIFSQSKEAQGSSSMPSNINRKIKYKFKNSLRLEANPRFAKSKRAATRQKTHEPDLGMDDLGSDNSSADLPNNEPLPLASMETKDEIIAATVQREQPHMMKRLVRSIRHWVVGLTTPKDRPSTAQFVIGGAFISVGAFLGNILGMTSTRIPHVHIVYSVSNLILTLVLSFLVNITELVFAFNIRKSRYHFAASLVITYAVDITHSTLRNSATYYFDHEGTGTITPNDFSNLEVSFIVSFILGIMYFLIGSGILVIVSHQQYELTIALRNLAIEKNNTDSLLQTMLPESIARRIKAGEHTINSKHDNVSIIFIDIASFTNICNAYPHGVILSTLHAIFSKFDELAAEHQVEKIKTIGDCWMGASGLKDGSADHAVRAVRMCADAVEWVTQFNEMHRKYQPTDDEWLTGSAGLAELRGAPYIQIKCGVSSGQCISGVIGRNRFQFDVWGRTVNLASRMQALCPGPQCIHISESTFRSLQQQTEDTEGEGDRQQELNSTDTLSEKQDMPVSELIKGFQSHGPTEVKGIGSMMSYYRHCLSPDRREEDRALAVRQRHFMKKLLTERSDIETARSGIKLMEILDNTRSTET